MSTGKKKWIIAVGLGFERHDPARAVLTQAKQTP